jgi:glycosyltransferase involved in cell wall biosynthesis
VNPLLGAGPRTNGAGGLGPAQTTGLIRELRLRWASVTLDIMIPFYGRFDHLREAVTSVLEQSSDDWRLTVIDDRFPDPEPGRWVAGLGDDRVRYRLNEHNLGVSGNFTRSVQLAETPYLTIMGCDDVLLPDYVKRVGLLLEAHPDADIVQPGVQTIDENGHPVRGLADRVKAFYRVSGRGVRVIEGQRLAHSLLRGNWLYFPSLVWRRELLTRGFREDFTVVQDLEMLLDIAYDDGRLVVDDRVVFAYRRHRSSVSAAHGPDGAKFAEERLLFTEAVRRCRELGWPEAERAARRHFSSRLHALSELPRVRDRAGLQSLLRHALGPL